MGQTWSLLLPPQPKFTEKSIRKLDGRVFIVTGGNAGIGLELVKMLYEHGGKCTIYIAARSQSRIDDSINNLKSTFGIKPAQLRSLVVDFNDLTTISQAVSTFLGLESRLDILWNNAGVAQQPIRATTVQGFEVHAGINCLGPYLFTKLLTPIIVKTAMSAPPNSVRVIWTGSQIIDSTGPKGGVDIKELEQGTWPDDKNYVYSVSKAGNWLLSAEMDKRVRKDGVISITQNPGNLWTKAWDPVPWLTKFLLSPVMYHVKYGGYTELWSGLSPDVTLDDGGKYAVPWGGRWHPCPRPDLLPSFKTKQEGGTGLAAEFWDWCDAKTAKYV